MIWIIGNGGMLGTELSNALPAAELETVGTDREVSILDAGSLAKFAKGKDISWIVNCAAYTAVEKAEEEVDLCAKLNAQGPENIARVAKAIGAKFLHISTDYVFDGSNSRPYCEDDPAAPTGIYGRTKAEGETRVRAAYPKHIILRTAWLYGKHGPNFVYTMLSLMATKEKIGVVADQHGTPTYAADLAAAIISILKTPDTKYGTYHATNTGATTWYDFACAIQAMGLEYGILDHPCAVEALTTAQYKTKVKRPAYSVLSKAKIIKDYSILCPEWRAGLSAFLQDIAENPSLKARVVPPRQETQ